MVDSVRLTLQPEIHPLYPPPPDFEGIWRGGGLYAHQYAVLATDASSGRIHAPTATGKSRAASFFAVSPFHRNKSERIQATFIYPTNILTGHQFEEGLLRGLVENLGYQDLGSRVWPPGSTVGVPYKRLRIPSDGELWIAKLTGTDLAHLLSDKAFSGGKADVLEDFLDWLNTNHNFFICSPDLIAYAVREMYGSSSFMYHKSVKRRVHSILRKRTVILDEYHSYDPFTLINLERLLDDKSLAPSRTLLLSATRRADFFPTIPGEIKSPAMPEPLPAPTSPIVASREIDVEFIFNSMPPPKPPSEGLMICIYNSVVENRAVCRRLRSMGVKLIQWDGTRKDECPRDEIGKSIHLVLGTSAIEVGLDLDADSLQTEWSPAWMQPEQITQRIGRVGRREKNIPADVKVFLPGALMESVRKPLASLCGKTMTKDELNVFLQSMFGDARFDRKAYVSYYYEKDCAKELVKRRLLQPNEELMYSFRPPGSQGLFLDRSEKEEHFFFYEKAPIVNRYDTRPPTEDEIDRIPDGYRVVGRGLGLDMMGGTDYLVILGERRERGWLRTPTGELKDLGMPQLRKYYIRGRQTSGRGQFI